MRVVQLSLVVLYSLALIGVGFLRYSEFNTTFLSPYAEYASYAYIAVTIAFIGLLSSVGSPLGRLGFERGPQWRDVLLALAGIAVLQLAGTLLEPLWVSLFGEGRDLSRFSDVEGSLVGLAALLVLNWSIAAFGEEFIFRIVLMRSTVAALGGGRIAIIFALFFQAAVFGLIHIYQGPAGVAGSFVSALIFGVLVLAARGAIWPAALAHGGNNTIGIFSLFFGR